MFLRVTHDDASTVTLGDHIGDQSCFVVVEAETTLRAVFSPIAVVVAVISAAAGLVAHLNVPTARNTEGQRKDVGGGKTLILETLRLNREFILKRKLRYSRIDRKP